MSNPFNPFQGPNEKCFMTTPFLPTHYNYGSRNGIFFPKIKIHFINIDSYSVIKLVLIYIMIFGYLFQNTQKSTYFVVYLVISCLATKVHADFACGEKPQKK
jgi:hypothetical protein